MRPILSCRAIIQGLITRESAVMEIVDKREATYYVYLGKEERRIISTCNEEAIVGDGEGRK